jgi:hypothetical protein
MSYTYKDIGAIGVDDESNYNQKTSISAIVDSLGMVGIRIGSDCTIRINEEDLDALRELLYKASRTLMSQRADKENHVDQKCDEDSYIEPDYQLCLNCQATYDANVGDCQDPICNSPHAFLANFL